MKCQSCGKQKNDIVGSKSALIPAMNVIVCQACRSKGFEPRHIVILAALGGHNEQRTKRYIAEKRYYGDEIRASEIL